MAEQVADCLDADTTPQEAHREAMPQTIWRVLGERKAGILHAALKNSRQGGSMYGRRGATILKNACDRVVRGRPNLR